MILYRTLINSKINIENELLKVITDYDIYCELAQIDFEFKKSYRSPLREDDVNPSFSLFCPTWDSARPDEIWYSDHAKRDKGNVFTFTRKFAYFQYGIELKSKIDTVEFLDKILRLNLFSSKTDVVYTGRQIDWVFIKKKAKIRFIERPYTRLDIYYWLKYGIDVELLLRYKVKSVKSLLDDEGYVRKTFSIYENVFVYVMVDEHRLYRPDADKQNKWRNTCPESYYQGEEQILGKDILILTKSIKDVMTFVSFMDVDSKAAQAEGLWFPEEEVKKYLNQYKHVYCVMDFDLTGVSSTNYLKRLGVKPLFVSTKREYNKELKLKTFNKDISDYCYNNGYIKTMEHLKCMFKDLPNKYFLDDRVNILQSKLDILLE